MPDQPPPLPGDHDPALDLKAAAEPGALIPLGRLPAGTPIPANDAPPPEGGEEMALRLARLRAQIAAGEYRTNPADVARAMVYRASG